MPIICDYLSREESRNYYDGETFHIGRIDMVVNTGTYIDSPFHRYESGDQFTENFIDRMVSTYNESKEVGISHFENLDMKGKAVLINTGWDAFWEQDAHFENNPYLSKEASIYLRDRGSNEVLFFSSKWKVKPGSL